MILARLCKGKIFGMLTVFSNSSKSLKASMPSSSTPCSPSGKGSRSTRAKITPLRLHLVLARRGREAAPRVLKAAIPALEHMEQKANTLHAPPAIALSN